MAEKIENVEDVTLADLKKKAEKAGVSRSGTKQEIADRINEQSTTEGAEGKDKSASKGVDSGNADEPRDDSEPTTGDPAGGSPATNTPPADAPENVDAAPIERYPAGAGPTDEDGEVALPVRTSETSKEAEARGKESSVPGSDPRNSVFDPAPGKTFTDVVERRNAHLRGEYQDAVHPKGVQYYIVQPDDASLIDVAMKIGLSDHSKLTAINGIFNSVLTVQPGQKILLPNDYTFNDIDNIETVEPVEQDGVALPPRLAAEEYDNRTDGERLITEEEQAKLRS